MTSNRAFVLLALIGGLAAGCLDGPRVTATPQPDAQPAEPPAAATTVAPDPQPEPQPDTAAALAAFERIAVIGASASAGFNLKIDLGADLPLAAVIDQSLAVPHGEVRSAASTQFFMDAELIADQLLEPIVAWEPTLVIAGDFLFWFGYGFFENERDRMVLLERGLDRLDQFTGSILVAALPDMRAAANTGMVAPAQVPSPEMLAALNQRIEQWAAQRPRVHLVPLAQLMERMRSGEQVSVGGYQWPADGPPLLQLDQLHPTLEGMTVLSFLVLETYCAATGLPPETIDRDPRDLADELRYLMDESPEVLLGG